MTVIRRLKLANVGPSVLTHLDVDADLTVIDLDDVDWSAAVEPFSTMGLTVGHATHALPANASSLLDSLTFTLAPSGPGRAWAAGTVDDLTSIIAAVKASPGAVSVLDSVLRVDAPTTEAALSVESMAYSMLLAGPEFASWRARTLRREISESAECVLLARTEDILSITLDHPERHNAFSRAMRDGLIDALDLAAIDSSIRRVVFTGNGRSFCSGGDLDEFGTTTDPVAAHLVRTRRSAAAALDRVRYKVHVIVHGACIGAGIEVPSFADRVTARPDARFRLPEIAMGLIPGAGGTVGIARRIGRWRVAYLALTGAFIDAETALEWGLVDEVTV